MPVDERDRAKAVIFEQRRRRAMLMLLLLMRNMNTVAYPKNLSLAYSYLLRWPQ
jgi:hypothetical protein